MSRPSYAWVLALVAVWLFGGMVLALYRPGQVPQEGLAYLLLGYALLGVISGGLLLWLVRHAEGKHPRIILVFAYLVVSPVAGVSALLGPLGIASPWIYIWVIAIYGLIPIGIALAFARWIIRSNVEDLEGPP
jgi:low temperature requirement protein LtrA